MWPDVESRMESGGMSPDFASDTPSVNLLSCPCGEQAVLGGLLLGDGLRLSPWRTAVELRKGVNLGLSGFLPEYRTVSPSSWMIWQYPQTCLVARLWWVISPEKRLLFCALVPNFFTSLKQSRVFQSSETFLGTLLYQTGPVMA